MYFVKAALLASFALAEEIFSSKDDIESYVEQVGQLVQVVMNDTTFSYAIEEAEIELPASQFTQLEPEPYGYAHSLVTPLDFIVLNEGDEVPIGYYVPRLATVLQFEAEIVDGIAGWGRVGFYGGYISGSNYRGQLNEAPILDPMKYVFNDWSVSEVIVVSVPDWNVYD